MDPCSPRSDRRTVGSVRRDRVRSLGSITRPDRQPVGSVRRDRVRSLVSHARPDRRSVGSVRRRKGATHRILLRRMGTAHQPPSRPKGDDRPVGRRATPPSSRSDGSRSSRSPRSSASRPWRPCRPSAKPEARARPRTTYVAAGHPIRPSIDPVGLGLPLRSNPLPPTDLARGSEHSGHTGTNEPGTASPTRVAGKSRFPRGSPVSPMRRAKLSSRSAPHPAGRSTTSPSGSWTSLLADTRHWILSRVTTQRRHEGSHPWSSVGEPRTPTGPPSTS